MNGPVKNFFSKKRKKLKKSRNSPLKGISTFIFHCTFKTTHKLFISNLLPFPTLTFWSSPRPISSSQLHALQHFHPCPINLVVFKGSYSYDGISHLEGGFTLRCLQRLSRPDLATLPWIWYPTDTPAVRPSRSSRTKDSSSQISYAHAG